MSKIENKLELSTKPLLTTDQAHWLSLGIITGRWEDSM